MSIASLYQKDKASSTGKFIFLNIYLLYKCEQDAGMDYMTCDEIRLKNARALSQRAGGDAALAALLEMEPPQINHLIGKNPKRNIGNTIARRIEQVCEVPRGWLDVYHPPEPNLMVEVSPEEARLIEVYRSSSTAKVLIDGAVNTSFSLPGLATGGGGLKTSAT